jgi:dienelactone hydrolase
VVPQHVSFPGGNLVLRGTLYTPQGDGPFPALIYNHGSAPGKVNDVAFEQLGPLFAARGWVFFAPYRRGQGLSAAAGPYVADEIASMGRKNERAKLLAVVIVTVASIAAVLVLMRGARRWVRASFALAMGLMGVVAGLMVDMDARRNATMQVLQTSHLADHLAAYEWLRTLRSVDTGRIATAGNSFGGIITVLAAAQVHYCAAVDAAGGAQTWSASVATGMTAAVRQSRAPIFFFQAENDYSLEPTQQLGEEMRKAGRPYEVKIYPVFGSSRADGHSFAWRGSSIWADEVFRFLNANCRTVPLTHQ